MLMAGVCLHITSITVLHRGKCGPLGVLLSSNVWPGSLDKKIKGKKTQNGRWNNKISGKGKQLKTPIMYS